MSTLFGGEDQLKAEMGVKDNKDTLWGKDRVVAEMDEKTEKVI